MKKLQFIKMEGSGNDFILLDNRRKEIEISNEWIKEICQRRKGIGADGVIIIEESEKADFFMRIINSDGSEAEMCGNGARCAAKFAQIKSIAEKEMTIETISGIVKANVKEKEVKISINNPINIELSQNLEINSEKILFHFINTGVPHTIIILEDIEKIDLRDLGRKIRFHQRFAPSGTNVDLAKIINNNEIYIRTYERGVEDETLSCGTGAIACACISYLLGKVAPPIKVITKSKEYLIVDFEEEFKNLTMEGPVRVIYEGKIYL